MDEAECQKDAALSLSDGGRLRQVPDQGCLESEGLTLGMVVSREAVRRTRVRLAIHRPKLSLVQSQLRVKQFSLKAKASQLLHI